MSGDPIDRVLARLAGVRRSGDGWTARCPAHEDRRASLSVGRGDDGRVLVHCHAGCAPEQIAGAIGLEMADLFAREPNGMRPRVRRPRNVPPDAQLTTYEYTDADGRPLWYRDRWDWLEGGARTKLCLPRRPDGTRAGSAPVPYRLPALRRAIAARELVVLVEGEKAADALAAHGYAATTTGPATSWRSDYAQHFRGARVVLWPDADPPGEQYIAAAARDLAPVVAELRVLRIPDARPHFDAADFFAEGGTADQLDRLLAEAPVYAAGAEGAEAAAPDDDELFPLLADLLERPELLRPPEPVLPRLVWRGRVTLHAAPDKSGKSTLWAHGTVAITRGLSFLGEPVVQGRVMWVGLEEALPDAVRRFHELGADPERVRILRLSPPDLLERLDRRIEAWPADLVVIDSLAEFARLTLGRAPEDGDASGWGAVVRPIVSLARRRDVAVALLHHPRRSDGQYRGSLEIAAAVDCLLEMTTPADGEDPTLRRMRGRARWPVEPWGWRLDGGRVVLGGAGELSVDARILADLAAHPGTSRTAQRDRVGVRKATYLATVANLIDRGLIAERNGRLYAPGDVPEMLL